MIKWQLILMYGSGYLGVLFLIAFLPYLTRKTECFGVGIPAEIYHTPELVRLRRNYRNGVLVAGLLIGGVILVLVWSGLARSWSRNLIEYGHFGILAAGTFFYIRGRGRLRKLKAEADWGVNQVQQVMVETGFRRQRITVSPWWFMGFFLIILATVGLGIFHYAQLPDLLPLFFDLRGGRMVRKTPQLLWLIPCLQLALTSMVAIVFHIIGRARQEVDPAAPARSLEQNRLFRYRWSVFAIGVGMMMLVMMGLPFLTGQVSQNFITWMHLVVTVVIAAWGIWLVVTTGQGGSRIGGDKDRKTGKIAPRDEDRFWLLGLLYFNPNDPSIFVERRFGIGWTVNLGRWESWGVITGVTLFMILVEVLISSLS